MVLSETTPWAARLVLFHNCHFPVQLCLKLSNLLFSCVEDPKKNKKNKSKDEEESVEEEDKDENAKEDNKEDKEDEVCLAICDKTQLYEMLI